MTIEEQLDILQYDFMPKWIDYKFSIRESFNKQYEMFKETGLFIFGVDPYFPETFEQYLNQRSESLTPFEAEVLKKTFEKGIKKEPTLPNRK